MARGKCSTDGADVIGGERRDDVEDAAVLLHDVPCSPPNHLGQRADVFPEKRRVDVAQRLDGRVDGAQRGDRRLALGATLVVRGRVETARHVAIDHDECDVVREGDRAPLERSTVKKQRGAGHTARNRELVHEPRSKAHVFVLGPLADPGEIERRRLIRRGAEQPPRGRELDRGTRRQAGTCRQRRGDHTADSTRSAAALGQGPGDACDVVDPRAVLRSADVEVERAPRSRVEPREVDPPIIGRCDGHPDLAIDRRRQHVAEVVIGVLADEVHATGGAHDLDRVPVGGRFRIALDQRLDQRSSVEGARHIDKRSRRILR